MRIAGKGTGLFQRKSVRALLLQGFVLAVLVSVILYVANNVAVNLANQGIASGFGFLESATEWDVGESLIAHNRLDPYWRTFLVGVINTLYVSAIALVLITVIGVLVGLSRVSNNWLLAKFASIYVEVFRNVPLILQIIFWYTVTREFPHAREAVVLFDTVLVSNRGVNFPVPTAETGYIYAFFSFLAGAIGAFILSRYSEIRRDRTGKPIKTLPYSLVLVVGLPVLVWWLFGAPTSMNLPEPGRFGIEGGGELSPEFLALLLGLSIHYSAQVGEIVRSGIESVPVGQYEAARAIGMKEGRIFRKIILPQTLRVVIPPTASQYMSAVRNSSLAVAIGYPELFSIGSTTINQSGQAVEVMLIMLLVYLTISLVIAGVMNFFNWLVAYKA